MKKFLALFLVLVMAFSCILVSCNKDKDTEGDSTDDDEGIVGIGTLATGSTTAGSGAATGSTNTDFTWTDDANGTMIYVLANGVNVRTDTNTTEDTYVATANFGESYKRLKYNDVWTLIEYKGNQYYISSKYITTNSGKVVFTNDAQESTVYVIAASLNLRSTTYTDDNHNLRTDAKKGTALTRIATSANGEWIKVRHTYTPYGATETVTEELYCNTMYVSADKDAAVTTQGPSLG